MDRSIFMVIVELKEVDASVVAAFERLIPQLTQYQPPPSAERLQAMAASETTFLFLARHPNPDGSIVGTATLGLFETPTGVHAWIEDVVVDQSARRLGIGRALTLACVDKARALGLKEVHLTSRPARAAANSLYQDMGFIQRETNVYRLPLT
jgi:ribosomal protein S18 acetylase RimI-like enzyme